jgi:capsular polysaccharide biosynthesis protein
MERLRSYYRNRLKRHAFLRVPKELLFMAWWLLRTRGLWGTARHVYLSKLKRHAIVRVPKEALFMWWWLFHTRGLRAIARLVLPARVVAAMLRVHAIGMRAKGMGLRVALAMWMRPPLRLQTQTAAAAAAGSRPRLVFNACPVVVPAPRMVPASLARTLEPLPEWEPTFPPVVVYTFAKAQSWARSNMLQIRGALVHHDLFRFSHDETSEELHGMMRIHPGRQNAYMFEPPVTPKRLAHAATFTDALSSNYAHWLTEVLPRMNAYVESGDLAPVALIDAGLHRNLLASARLVLPPSVQIVELKGGESVAAERLDVVSCTGYIPFGRRGDARDGHRHGTFSAAAIQALRERLIRAVGPSERPFPKRVLLRRGSTSRALLNEQAVADALAPRGFEAVYPERLSFDQQVQLFAGADVIVGATGAALANCIFCSPQARILVCISNHPEHSFGYWQAMARAAGLHGVEYVLGTVGGGMAAGVHSNFSIEPAALLDALGEVDTSRHSAPGSASEGQRVRNELR